MLCCNQLSLFATHVDQWFNTNSCITYDKLIAMNATAQEKSEMNITLPIQEFWHKFVLRRSEEGLESIGGLDNLPMIGCMAFAWIMIYFCIFRGTQSTGKIIYFTSVFPFITLLVILVRGCTLPGAIKGIEFYLKPNMTQLTRAEVWVQAGSQVCYSYAICFAVLVAYGSYSSFNSNCYKRTFYLSVSCSLTSFIGGFAVFAVLGNMAQVLGMDVKDCVKSGPGLAFITYPTALSLMPLPQFWNACFFLMLILLAVDSQFCCLEGGLCIFYDRYEWTRKNRELFVGIVCFSLFLFGLLFVTPGGVYIFEIFNNYAVGGISLLWLVTWQSIGIGWVYGAKRYYEIINRMIGYYPSPYMSICFCYLCPALTSSVTLFYMVNYTPLQIDTYVYPSWANALGWLLLMSSFLCVPGWALFEIYNAEGNLLERIKYACKPRIPVPGEPEKKHEEVTMMTYMTHKPVPYSV